MSTIKKNSILDNVSSNVNNCIGSPSSSTSSTSSSSHSPSPHKHYEACPFNHQVGGHGPVVSLVGTNMVAKPLDARQKECRFYQRAPKALLPFVPAFHGLASVKFSTDAIKSVRRHRKSQSTTPQTPVTPSSTSASTSTTPKTGVEPFTISQPNLTAADLTAADTNFARSQRSPSQSSTSSSSSSNGNESPCTPPPTTAYTLVDTRSNDDSNSQLADQQGRCSSPRSPQSPNGNGGNVNPWSIQMFKKQISSSKQNGIVNCILLENLTERFEHPCILDVKIGTRSYDDAMDMKKKERHLAKAKSTTTGALGFRICGSQVYSHEKETYLCHDKYYGRSLTTTTITDSLREFFETNTGRPPRTCPTNKKIVLALLKRINELKQVVQGQKGLRFYSSSLLLLYEGSPNAAAQPPMVDVRVIDFAHTSFYGENNDESNSPDNGFLFGLENLSSRLRSIISDDLVIQSTPTPPQSPSLTSPRHK